MSRKFAFAMLAVLLTSACVGQGSVGQTNLESQDVVITSNEPTIPAKPASGTAFTARFTVKNQHEERTAEDVGVWIFDTGKCKLQKVNGINADDIVQGGGSSQVWPGLTIETEGGLKHVTDFVAGQQEVVRLDFDAPTAAEVVGLRSECPIRYRVNYSFSAVSEMTVQAISSARLAAREAETGARPTFSRTLNIGAGPIRVFMEPKTQLPVESGRRMQVELIIKNEGGGEFNRIAPGQLKLSLDSNWAAELTDGQACGDFFDAGTAEGDRTVYANVRTIDVIQKASNPIRCTWTAPEVELEKQSVVQARLPYTYEYFGPQITVPIAP